MTPWVMRLIIANVIVFFLTMTSPALANLLSYIPAYTATRPWTPFTYMFVHAGPGHILFNMLSLYFFGPRLEARLGSRHFLGMYLAGGLTGALASLIAYWVGASPGVIQIVGASGAVYSVMLGFALFWPRTRVLVYGLFPVEAWFLILVMILLTLFGTAGFGSPGVAHFAHLGGAAGGFAYLRIVDAVSPAAQFRARANPTPKRVDGADLERWKRINRDAMHPVNREEFDRLMVKITEAGVASLSRDERMFLDRFTPA
ncbi:MAG TPA: rhomboid family intramembrane serine protease [Gemmatimonadales bacterium]